jgi:hypothetical protein
MPLHSTQQVTLLSDIMGFLGVGKPIGFAAAKAKGINAEVKRRGITQFISHFRRCLPMTRRPLLFGDEIEYSPLKSRTAFWFRAQTDARAAGTSSCASTKRREMRGRGPHRISCAKIE